MALAATAVFSTPTSAAPSTSSPSTSISFSFRWSATEPVLSIRIAAAARFFLPTSAFFRPRAVTLTADSPADGCCAPPRVLLEVKGQKAIVKESKQEILRGVDLTVNEGEVLVGHPNYEVTGGSVFFKGENLLDMEPEERSHAGLFMSF